MTKSSGLMACVVVALAATGGAGQSALELDLERGQEWVQERGSERGLEAVTAEAATLSARAESRGEDGSGVSWSTVAHRVGGALVGGWVGYVGAQVVQSDWAKESNGSFRGQRSVWAVAGALAGVVGSHVVGKTVAPVMVPDRLDHYAREQREITTEELREAGNASAYEVVQRLRPRWLVTRGTNSLSETPRGWGAGRQVVIVPGNDKIKVYLDDVRLGGVAEMRKIASDGLTSIRFLNPRDATYRYGTGHTHGAILLSAVVPAP
jgi:hypothetical protein